MPNIDVLTLGGIPGIGVNTVNQMTQATANACGAYALVAAVGAFKKFPVQVGGLPIAYQNAGPNRVARNAVLMDTSTYSLLAASIYQVVGILNLPVLALSSPVLPELGNGADLFNSPAAMASVAMQIGARLPELTVSVHTNPAGASLLALYPGEVQRCQCAVGAANVNEKMTAAYVPPAPNQTQIICVQHPSGGLHWLARGSNGDWYDPAHGTTNNIWSLDLGNNQIQDGLLKVVYWFSGVWLTIEG